MRDSYGTSGQVETPNGAKRQEAHRSPRGKRASETEINYFQKKRKSVAEFCYAFVFSFA
ncbi:hypothetical protein QUF49_05960 [Fictibacillus sp. b24]|uniref:hypothetical protein n=1 Tax=Fictibacillus sp. b24 TaxID=3055863 RepID=UPI0025A205A6|nr:hypothetical protein [Fictibacillus sp. b24]MDM5315534.1 hypothetical protein [Fictibacillus sp. b24]